MMKARILLFSSLLLISAAQSQHLYLHSKDTVNGLPEYEVGVGGWIKLSLIYDRIGVETTAALNPIFIPTGDYEPDPQFTGDMHQSRLKFRSIYRNKTLGEISAYVEGDFYGNAGKGGFRLRHAYIKSERLLVGQYWTAFTDVDAWPNVADFDGPPTGIWKRIPQIRYIQPLNEKSWISLSLEASFPEYIRVIDSLRVDELNQNIPNLAANYMIRKEWGGFQLSGIFRNIRYEKPDSSRSYLQGWGVAVSGNLIAFRKDNFMYQLAIGEGITSYMSSFGGQGLDIVILPDGSSDVIPASGGYLSYRHFWGKGTSWSSNLLFGYVILSNNWLENLDKAMTGTSSSININWTPAWNLSTFLELQYATHHDLYGEWGDAVRLMFTVEYSF